MRCWHGVKEQESGLACSVGWCPLDACVCYSELVFDAAMGGVLVLGSPETGLIVEVNWHGPAS